MAEDAPEVARLQHRERLSQGASEPVDVVTGGTDGIGWQAFESVLYGKYRLGEAQADLDKCKDQMVETSDNPISEDA